MFPFEILSEPVLLRVGSTLLHFLWQGFAVAALAWLALRCFGGLNARRRYAISLASLALMAACPLVTYSVLSIETQLSSVELAAGPIEVEGSTIEHLTIAERGETASDAPLPLDSAGPRSAFDWHRLSPLRAYLVPAWLAGVLVLSVRLLFGYAGIHWLRRGGRAIDSEWQGRFDRLASRLGLSRARVRLTTRVSEALVVGFWRPLVLLPASWLAELPPATLEAIVAHELAHLRRYDLWVNLLQRVLETLLFYHPAVWWLSSRVRLERELCCDELAVAITGRRVEYVTALELVARKRLVSPRPLLAAPIGGENAMTLLNRVRNILGISPAPDRARIWPAGLLLLAAPVALWAVTSGLLSGGQPKATADEERVEKKEGERKDAERVEKKEGERREGERKEGERREEVRKEGERREGERREGERREEVRKVEIRKEGDRPAERKVEVRREEERPAAPREGAGRDDALIKLIQQLREEVATLRAEVRELRARTGGREGDVKRDLEIRRDEIRRDADRPKLEGERRDVGRPKDAPRDGDRPKEGVRRDGDRPKEGARDDDRPRPDAPRRDGDRPKEGPRDGDRPKEGPRDGDREKPKAVGVISAVAETGKIVEISVGSDDGIKTGQILAIIRGDNYLGRVHILKVAPDRSVGEPSLSGKDVKLEKGDQVISNVETRP
jgi:beta-lactamase regulating signal transducer with metallopeptidase domain